MHIFQPKSFNKEQEYILRSTAEPSRYIENFLSQDEFDFCRTLFDSPIEWPEHGKVSKYWGFDWNSGPGPDLFWLKTKINSVLKNWELDFLALQEAIVPWNLHADIRWYADKVPYKVMLIPLDVEPDVGPTSVDMWPDTYTITFDQRNFLCNWPADAAARAGNDQSYSLKPIDNPMIEGIVDGMSISREQWAKLLDHIPYEHLQGLTIDRVNKWIPKSMMFWDSTAVHCADNFLKKQIRTKRSLMAFLVYKQGDRHETR